LREPWVRQLAVNIDENIVRPAIRVIAPGQHITFREVDHLDIRGVMGFNSNAGSSSA
jgi:hypothetical protein